VNRVGKAVDWAFRDRRTGRIVVAQWPNLPLGLWLGATAAQSLFDTGEAVLGTVGAVALGWWAVAEVGWGVNPWRRLLGTVVLAGLAASLVP
jgi:hypothetical protein